MLQGSVRTADQIAPGHVLCSLTIPSAPTHVVIEGVPQRMASSTLPFMPAPKRIGASSTRAFIITSLALFCPAFNQKALFGVVQLRRFFRRIGTVNMQLNLGQFGSNSRPYMLLQLQHGIPIGGVSEITNMHKMRAFMVARRYRFLLFNT